MRWSKNIQSRFALASLISLGIAGALLVPVHAVLDGELPTPSDFEAGGEKGRVDLHLKDLEVAQVVKNKMAAYYPSWDSSANGKSIKVTVGKEGKVCNINKSDPKMSGSLVVFIKIANNQTPTSGQYRIPIKKVCDTDQFYSHVFPFPNGNLEYDDGSRKYKATIEVYFDGTTTIQDDEGLDLNYRLEIMGNNRSNGVLALTKSEFENRFGLRSAWAGRVGQAGNQQVKASIPFGYTCDANVDKDDMRTLKLYDADGVFGDTYMWVEKNGSKLDKGAYAAGKDRLIDSWDAGNKRWKLKDSNNDYNQVVIEKTAIKRGASYKLVINNPGVGYSVSPHYNTLSVAIPTDSIYSEGNCDYTLRPSISIAPPKYSYYPNITVSASISKGGNAVVPEQHPWEVYAVRYPNAVNRNIGGEHGDDACSVVPAGGSGCTPISPPNLKYDNSSSTSLTYSAGGPDAPGTRLCFFARIQNPSDDVNDDDKWWYTDLDCAVSGILPKTQIWGYDVLSGKVVTTSVTKHPSAVYGSWGEYGIFSAGANTGMASASGLVNGSGDSSQAGWSHITGANDLSCAGDYGCYGAQSYPSSLLQKLKTYATAPCAGNVATSAIDLGDKNNITGTHVICSTGTVTVDTNLRYASTAINQPVPQVIIVAKDIIINENVSRIDSWLVAGDGNQTGGSVYTCNRWTNAGTQLRNNICNTQLTINGPVIAPRIYLGRTYDEYTTNFKVAAETINLRADTFVWASQGSNPVGNPVSAQTVSVKELPPRY